MDEQRRNALARANRTRSAKAAFKAGIRSMDGSQAITRVATVFRDPRGVEPSLKVGELLTVIPMVGDTTARHIGRICDTALHDRISRVPAQKRERIARQLEMMSTRTPARDRQVA